MRLFLLAILALFIAGSSRTTVLGGLTVNGYSAATADRYDRFNNSADFLGNPYDWSGVGRTAGGRWGTLISPSFVISATHLAPVQGDSIRFYSGNDAAGSFVERTIVENFVLTESGFSSSSDLVLTQLSGPVTGVSPYAIAPPTSPANLIGQEIYVWGQADTIPFQTSMRLGRNEIFDVLPVNNGISEGTVIVYDYNTTTGLGADEARVELGDSGGPSFLIGPNGPAIVGVHWFNTVPADGLTGPRMGSGDTLVSSFIAELNDAMAATGSDERITVAAVPEPSSVAWLLIGLGSALMRRRRRTLY